MEIKLYGFASSRQRCREGREAESQNEARTTKGGKQINMAIGRRERKQKGYER